MSDDAPLALRERHALCDLALLVGPTAPTLCEGWDVSDLVAHLLVRERKPWTSVGIVLPPAAGLTQRAMDRLKERDFRVLVGQLRDPAPLLVGPVDRMVNTVELFVHHEDVRRAQPSWEPRQLTRADEATLWRFLAGAGRLVVRRAGVPVRVARAHAPGRPVTLKGGDNAVTVTGPVSELMMFVHGRKQVRDLTFDGPPESVASLKQASLGI